MRPPRSLRTSVAAKRLGVSTRTVRRWAARGDFPNARRVGSLWFFDPSEVDAVSNGQPLAVSDLSDLSGNLEKGEESP